MNPVFKITYWGATGTFCDPLRPKEITGKLVEAIRTLVEKDCLQQLRPGADLEAAVHDLLARELPFHLRSSFGGNTTCIEVETPDALIILDSGSGFRELGLALTARWEAQGPSANRSAHILLSHGHMDHTFATPYFDPYYDPANAFTVCAAQATLDSISAVLDPNSSLSRVFFPPTLEKLPGLRKFQPLLPGAEFHLGTTRIQTLALRHPGGALAFRLENSGRSFVFASDHEHQDVPDEELAAFAANADLFYTEGQYSQAEYDGSDGIGPSPPMSRRGWGHSPLPACVATAVASGARRLHIGHRDPCRDDQQIAHFEERLRQLVREELARLGKPPETCEALVPYEGMSVYL